MSFMYYGLLTLFLILSVFLMLLVLIQKGRGGGLSAAFGGVGGNTAFGAKTGDVLTWATSAVFALFLLLAIGLNLIANRIHSEATNLRAPEPAAAAVPSTAPSASDVSSSSTVMAPPVNPTPTPPPTPTTNPSTNPTRMELPHDAASPAADPAVPATKPAK